MSGFVRCTLALVLVMAMSAASLAQRGGKGGGGHPGGGGGGGGRPSASVPRAAPVSRAPQPHQAPPNPGGFNFNRDINARPAPAPQRPATAQRPISAGNATVRTVANFPHAPNIAGGGGPYHGQFRGSVIANPHHWNGTWGWNRGIVWQPAPTYWGGGFWGPLAIAALTGALLFGSIIDYQNQVIYPSYQIEPNSPGAQLLQNYGLQQTACGPPNLVVIWGPNNSVICAYPNNLITPGNYELDPSTLTIVSQSS